MAPFISSVPSSPPPSLPKPFHGPRVNFKGLIHCSLSRELRKFVESEDLVDFLLIFVSEPRAGGEATASLQGWGAW